MMGRDWRALLDTIKQIAAEKMFVQIQMLMECRVSFAF